MRRLVNFWKVDKSNLGLREILFFEKTGFFASIHPKTILFAPFSTIYPSKLHFIPSNFFLEKKPIPLSHSFH
jgi:hypothetical protein